MPKRRKTAPARPTPIQLPLFAETASLVRILPALHDWRYYRMEIWPDLFGRALLVRQWGASAPKAVAGSTRIPIQVRRSTPLPTFSGPSAAAATRTAPGDDTTSAASTIRKRRW
jgi:hypothetical protein